MTADLEADFSSQPRGLVAAWREEGLFPVHSGALQKAAVKGVTVPSCLQAPSTLGGHVPQELGVIGTAWISACCTGF